MTDLLDLTRALVAIPSVSRSETALADFIETALRGVPWLDVVRVGDNLVARTDLGRRSRVLVAGHTDTVPASANEVPRVEGDRLFGLGAADMKSGLAVMVDLARTLEEPAVDVTYVFYAREEVASAESGLLELAEVSPDLLVADVAIIGEPTGAQIEAGCQGSIRVRVEIVGQRAHTARPWVGRNAVHRLGRVIAALEDQPERRPVIDGCEYREATQAVFIEGGVAGNVVPDSASVTINHRFAPDRSPEQAEASLREALAPVLEEGDSFKVVDVVPGALPALDHELLRALIDRNGLEVRAKLGWTDVAWFAGLGVPATNFGPGEASVSHTAGEFVDRAPIERVHAALGDLLTSGA